MPLDPQARAYLDQLNAAPPMHTQPPEKTREARRALYGKVEDRQITGPDGNIPIRVYTPAGVGPFPVLVYFHGGGFVLGDIDGSDPYCRALTNWAGCITISVDYRLAPEHKFPAAVEDCYAATLWTAQNAATFNGDPARIAVGGDSAGGTLAAVVPLLARDRGTPHLVFQLLDYPATDFSRYDTESWQVLGSGHVWTREASQLFVDRFYLRNEADARDPLASPLLAPDLSGLPPALVITAEYDPLRDEGEAYAVRLQQAGVPVEVRRYPGMIHGFFGASASALDQSIEAVADVVKAFKVAFARQDERMG